MEIKVSTFRGQALARVFTKSADKAMRAGAEFAAIDTPQRIRAGLDPEGAAQKPNAESTRRSKQKRLGHAIPLVADQQYLSQVGGYKVTRKSNGTYVVEPPGPRAAVVPHLRALGYRLLEISSDVTAFIRRRVKQEIASAARGLFSRKG